MFATYRELASPQNDDSPQRYGWQPVNGLAEIAVPGANDWMVNIRTVDGHVESLTMKDLEAPGKDYTIF